MEFRKNDIVTVDIEDIGSEGEGIGRVEGFALFVKDALPGDRVEAFRPFPMSSSFYLKRIRSETV